MDGKASENYILYLIYMSGHSHTSGSQTCTRHVRRVSRTQTDPTHRRTR